MVEYRTSIEAIHKVYDTNGSSPVLVTCDDIEDWVCKYDQSVNSLFNEFIASRFLNLWGLSTPPMSLVTVLPEHIPNTMIGGRLQTRFFQKHCFGSKLLLHAKEVDEFFEIFKSNYYELAKINSREDFLKIGLFDLWISNEDRNHNNYNLILKPEQDGTYTFNAIDHVACFNSGGLNMPLYHLTQDETLLTTDAAKILFSKGVKLNAALDNLAEDLYLCSNECHENLEDILADLPDSWGIDRAQVRNYIEQIFDKNWLQQTEQIFRQYVQLGIH